MADVARASARPAMVAAVAVLLGSCVAPAPAPPPPGPPRAPPPAAALPAAPVGEDWRDVPLTPGSWAYRTEGAVSVAQFGPAGGAAAFALRCDHATRRITFSRAAPAAGVAAPAMLGFVTSFGNFAYPARAAAGQPPAMTAQVPAADPNLDKLAFSRGRFLVTLGGTARLVIPAWPEVGRVIEDCRG